MLTIYCMIEGLAGKYGCSEVVMGISIGEFSNLFLTIRMLLKYQFVKQNSLYIINEYLFAGTFLICRIFIGPAQAIYQFTNVNTPWGIKILGICLPMISSIWIKEIICTLGMKFFSNSKSRFAKLFFQLTNSLMK